MKKKIVWSIVLLGLGAGLVYFGYAYVFNPKKPVYYWRLAKIEKGNVNLIVTATGLVNADTTVAVGTQVSGIVSKLYADYNSKVKKGKVIAQIDTTVLHATKEEAEAACEKAQAQLDQAKREYDRQKTLFGTSSISQADYDLALTNLQTANSTLRSTKAEMERAIVNLHYATVRSPINGIVISRNIDQGQTVIASFNSPTLFTIVNDLKKMQVQANVSEADIGLIKIGQEADFSVDAYPEDIFKGHVQQIRLQPVMVQNVVNYIVIIDAPNPDFKLMPGLTANIDIKIQSHSNILKVPANALSFIPSDDYLNVNELLTDSIKTLWRQMIASNAGNLISPKKDRGWLWLKKDNDIYPVEVIKGISDGIFTEIEGVIYEGLEVVTGLNHAASEAQKASGSQNPFLPKFPTRNKKN